MQSVKPPRPVTVVAGWLAAALVATLAGLGGIRLVGDSLTGTQGGVISEDEVAQRLAAAPASRAAPPTTSAPAPSPSVAKPARAVFTSAGNTATVHCEPGDRAYLDSWSPAPGYRVRDYDRGPDDDVRVRFEGSGGRIELKFFCANGVPQRQAEHGGGGDDD